MQVCHLTTAAQYFHLLRRQQRRSFRKPLILMTPKSMLRLKAAASATADFTSGYFKAVEPDTTVDPAGVRKALLCSGKVYWDLVAERSAKAVTDTAIIRLERLYPLPFRTLPLALDNYPHLEEVRWVQEEPANQGAWTFMALAVPDVIGRPLVGVSRPASSSPAVGSHHRHDSEQRQLAVDAFA
jgi:2-oxoglutarate dehydrogenase E1 component